MRCKNLGKTWADDIESQRGEWRLSDGSAKSKRAFSIEERGDEAAAACERGRKRAKVEASDDREGAERADEEFVEVVAGDVLDDAAAALGDGAGAGDEFGADQEIAGSAVELAERRVDAGGEHAADSAAGIPGNEERKELMVFEQSGVQFCDGRAGAGAESEVAGIVVDDLVESGHIESDVVAGGRHADAEFGARAARDKGEFFKRGEANDFGDLFSGSRYCNGGGDDFVYGIVGMCGGIGENMRSAEDGFQCGDEID